MVAGLLTSLLFRWAALGLVIIFSLMLAGMMLGNKIYRVCRP